jgi:hypothetical protein
MPNTKITTIDRLKEHADTPEGVDCFISMGEGHLRSSKHIIYNNDVWTVYHSIDESINVYESDREFFEKEDSIIDAIIEGSFYLY